MIIPETIAHFTAKMFFCALLLMPSDTARKVNIEASINPRISTQQLEQKTRFLNDNFDSLEIEINKCKAKKELKAKQDTIKK